MAISFECEGCGRRLRARDEHAERRTRCPSCGASVEVPRYSVVAPIEIPAGLGEPVKDGRLAVLRPEWPPDLAPTSPPAREQTAPKRPFWRDPVVILGTLVPTAILTAFAIYLYRDYSAKRFVRWVASERAHAERLAAAGRLDEASVTYRHLALEGESWAPTEPATMASIQLADREAARLAQQFAAQQAERKRELAAKEKEDRELIEAFAEQARLSRIRAEIRGNMFLMTKAGTTRVIPGVVVSLLPRLLFRGDLRPAFEATRQRATSLVAASERIAGGRKSGSASADVDMGRRVIQAVDKALSLPDDDLVDLAAVRGVMLLALLGDANGKSEGTRYGILSRGELWAPVAVENRDATAHTGLEGQYRFTGVHGGDYYLWAVYRSDISYVEWLVAVKVSQDGVIEQDLYSGNAGEIANDD